MQELTYKSLAAALVAAQSAAQAVAKSSTNLHHRYKYASAESLIEEARGCLTQAGLAVLPISRQVVAAVAGGTELLSTFELIHAASGESKTLTASMSVQPGNGRPQDKAEAAAATLNLGYFLRDLLLLPREDETTAVDRRDDTRHELASPPVKGDAVTAAVAAIEAASSLEELRSAGDNARKLGATNDASVRGAYEARFAALRAASAR